MCILYKHKYTHSYIKVKTVDINSYIKVKTLDIQNNVNWPQRDYAK